MLERDKQCHFDMVTIAVSGLEDAEGVIAGLGGEAKRSYKSAKVSATP